MQPSKRERPAETFPIQCHVCAEIFDVVADVDERSDCHVRDFGVDCRKRKTLSLNVRRGSSLKN